MNPRFIAFLTLLTVIAVFFSVSFGHIEPMNGFVAILTVLYSAAFLVQSSKRSAHCLGALTLINLTGFQRGINAEETGINCSRFSIEVEPEINEWLPGINGQARGKAVGDPMGKLTIEGEISGATGVMAAVFTTAFVPANTATYFGRSAGGFYLDRATVDEERDGWLKVSTEFSSRFNVS